jgi:hypothetical protein
VYITKTLLLASRTLRTQWTTRLPAH